MSKSDIALPSWSNDAEQGLLGSMLASNRACIDTIKEMQPEDFFVLGHAHIFSAIKEISIGGEVDIITLRNQLVASETLADAGGMDYVMQLLEMVPSAANAPYYAKIVKDKKFQRDMSSVSVKIRSAAFDANFETNEERFELIETSMKELRESYSRVNRVSPSLRSVVMDLADDLCNSFNGVDQKSRSTGWRCLDNALSGWFPGDQVIIGAFTGDGKTAFMSDAVLRCAARGGVCLIGSGEMTAKSLAMRMVQAETGVAVGDMRRGTFDGNQYNAMDAAMAKLMKLPVYIEDKLLKPDQLYAKAMRIKREHGALDVITQDYAQLLTRFCKRGGVDEMDAMMNEYKDMAKDLGATTLILSQYNTESQKENRPPTLKDLKGTGGIVASADWVLLLHRPDKKKWGRESAACYVAKARFGSPQKLDMDFLAHHATWLDVGEQK